MLNKKRAFLRLRIFRRVAAMFGMAFGCAVIIVAVFAYYFAWGGPLPMVSQERFHQLKIGMSKKEVRSLLGTPWIEVGDSGNPNGKEFWRWRWASGFDRHSPDPRSQVVWFDRDSQVDSWREPLGASE